MHACICCQSSYSKELLAQYLINCLRNFTKFTTSMQLGTKMNWSDFDIKRSEVKVTAKPNAFVHTDQQFAIEDHLVYTVAPCYNAHQCNTHSDIMRIWHGTPFYAWQLTDSTWMNAKRNIWCGCETEAFPQPVCRLICFPAVLHTSSMAADAAAVGETLRCRIAAIKHSHALTVERVDCC